MWFLISTKILWIIWIITKLKLKNEILKSIFDKFFDNLCTKKKLVKDIKIFLKKIKKQQYGHERYKNLSKDEKQNLVEYRKEYYRMRKNTMLQKLIT